MENIVDDVQELSAGLKPKPLGPDEKAVFRLCSVGKKEYGREEPTAPEVYQLTAKERIIDPFEKDAKGKAVRVNKTIGTYVVENKQVGNRLQAIYKAPQFIKGYCVVGSDEPGMYDRLMRSRMNVSNKFRKSMGKCKDVFMLVEDNKEISDQLMLEDLRLDAQIMVKQGSWMKLKEIAEKMNTSPDQKHHVKSYKPGMNDNITGLKLELIQLAKTYPKAVITCSDDEKAKLTVQVLEGLNFGVLIYQKDAYWLMDSGAEGIRKIHQPGVDEDKKESLIQYLMSDKAEATYVEFSNLLEKALGLKA